MGWLSDSLSSINSPQVVCYNNTASLLTAGICISCNVSVSPHFSAEGNSISVSINMTINYNVPVLLLQHSTRLKAHERRPRRVSGFSKLNITRHYTEQGSAQALLLPPLKHTECRRRPQRSQPNAVYLPRRVSVPYLRGPVLRNGHHLAAVGRNCHSGDAVGVATEGHALYAAGLGREQG